MRSSALIRGTVALTATAVTAGLLTAAAGAANAATPPYEPDPGAVGTITFYDTSGAAITSGSTDVPFAGYAIGSAAPRTGDTTAGLTFANPQPNTATHDWYQQLTGTFTSYPVTSGPASISGATGPVYTVGSKDETIDSFESSATAYTGTGYTDMVQVRLYTSNAGGQVTSTYDDADLLIDSAAHTWTEVYPTGGGGGTVTAHSTSLSIGAPSAVKYGATAHITGSLRDTTKGSALGGQSVSLYSGSKKLTTVKSSSSGALSASVKLTGLAKLHWALAATSAYKASSSSTKTVAVTTSVSISALHSTIKHGQTLVLSGTTTPATTGIHVTLQQLEGGKYKNVSTAVQKKQSLPGHKAAVRYRLNRKLTKKGTYHFRVVKAATSTLRGSTSKAITVHVK